MYKSDGLAAVSSLVNAVATTDSVRILASLRSQDRLS